MILVLLLFWGGSVWRRGQVDVGADAKTAGGAGGGATIGGSVFGTDDRGGEVRDGDDYAGREREVEDGVGMGAGDVCAAADDLCAVAGWR